MALVVLVGGGDGWHRLMIGGAAGGGFGGVDGGEGLGCGGGAGAWRGLTNHGRAERP